MDWPGICELGMGVLMGATGLGLIGDTLFPNSAFFGTPRRSTRPVGEVPVADGQETSVDRRVAEAVDSLLHAGVPLPAGSEAPAFEGSPEDKAFRDQLVRNTEKAMNDILKDIAIAHGLGRASERMILLGLDNKLHPPEG